MEFYIGQIFEGIYPPEAAIWCNNSQKAYIQECKDSNPIARKYQIVAIPDKTKEQILQEAKNSRMIAVNSITVIVDGMEFDGNEISQNRMLHAINVLQDGESILWVLHNNTVKRVTKEQLKEVLKLSIEQQSLLWIEPYMKDTEQND